MSQKWRIRFLEHRIGDKRIIRLVQKWLKAGALEDGVVSVSEWGTGQGAVSPLLANIYLHYVGLASSLGEKQSPQDQEFPSPDSKASKAMRVA